jgi:hypothetical protein
MRPPSLGAVLSISVDLEPNPGRAGEASSEQIRTLTRELGELFGKTRLAATWSSANPAASEPIDWVHRDGLPHEVALCVPREWSQDGEGHSRFATELVRRTIRARQAGISVTTLALAAGSSVQPNEIEHKELLVKYGFTAIRAPGTTLGRLPDASAAPTALRYGLWQITPHLRLAGGSAFGQWLLVGRIRRAIDRSIRGGWPMHLVIDGPSLASHSSRERLGALRNVLRHVKRRREEGALTVLTCAQTIARLSAPRLQTSAQSILRAA